LAGSIVCWSTVPLFLRYFTTYIDAWTANGLRYPMAMVIWLPWLVALLRDRTQPRQFYMRALIPAGVNFGGQCFWALAPYYIYPGLIAFVVRLTVLWTVIAAMIIFVDERSLARSRRFWAGLALAAMGFVGVSAYSGALRGGASLAGVLISLGCSLLWGLYGVTVRWSMRGVDARKAFALIGWYTAAATIVVMVIAGEPTQARTMPAGAVLLLIASSVVGVAFAHVLYYAAIAQLGVAIAGGALLISPFLTASASYFLYGERLVLQQWAGGFVLVVGAAVLLWAQQHLRVPIDAPQPSERAVPRKEPGQSRRALEGQAGPNVTQC
jgi:drug/metabolite transporter (DMT)-like permease